MFGFAAYASKASAQAAVNKLNGATVDDNQLKVSDWYDWQSTES